MALELICSCGRSLRVSEAHAGRQVKCPGCGKEHLVPASTPASGSQPGKQGARTPAGSKRGPLLLIAVLLLAGAVGLWWYFTRDRGTTGPEVSDLTLIPANALGFARVRFAEVWNSPQVKEAVEKERLRDPRTPGPAARFENDTGLSPESVERLYAVGLDAEKRIGWLVVRTGAPYDQGKVLAQLPTRQKQVHLGKTYHLGENRAGQQVALYFVSPRLLVAAQNVESMHRCLEQLARPVTTGPLEPILIRCEDADHVVGGLHLSEDMRAKMSETPIVKMLADIQRAAITMNLREQVEIEIRTQADNEENAAKLHKTFQSLGAQVKLYALVLALKGGEQAELVTKAATLLDRAKFHQEGAEVIGALKTDAGEVIGGAVEMSRRK